MSGTDRLAPANPASTQFGASDVYDVPGPGAYDPARALAGPSSALRNVERPEPVLENGRSAPSIPGLQRGADLTSDGGAREQSISREGPVGPRLSSVITHRLPQRSRSARRFSCT